MDNSAPDQQSPNQYDDEIDLRELFGVLWAGKIKIIAITAVFAIASVIYALSVPNQYKAAALLAPAQSSGGGLSGALGQLGGLASLAGVSLGGGESSEGQIAQEIMKSWSYIEAFIAENNIAVEVYAAQGWSKGSNELQIDADLYDTETKTWLVENDNVGEVGPPSSWKLFESFSKRLAVSEDKKSGLVSVSIEYYSPQVAKQWVDLYVESINRFMQQRQVDKVTRNIAYLQEQIGKTSIAEMQEVFYSIIEEQTKSKMLAEASPDYAFVAVGPSMVPEEKSQPKRALICILGTLLGGMLSVLLVLIMHYTKKSD
ncbi:MAG: Wzz/FepE/Etk N-terminal domain-containing protein [Proteobacteria bacterium]|nr:Wzz/FepE/Etk N-terminal domain-containing protein [Pseudomonadota bacterium]MDA1352819.1 Wzz/FepE/Etk N-terminal domain-containing protein [Pseudomonadota bacterium]